MDVNVEIELFENRQVVVPELNRRVENKPWLFGLLAQLHCFNDVMGELRFLFAEGLFLHVSKLSLLLVFLQSNKLFVAYLDVRI